MIARTNGRPAPIPEPRVLREYALIADGERGALLGPHGEIAWLGFPGWDGGILFGALVGGGGRYSVSPADVHVWGGRYVHGTLIWCHRWLTRGGALIECREALAFPGERERAVVLRRLEARSDLGEVDVRIELVDPVDGRPLRPRRSADAWLWRGGGLEARLIGAPELGGDRQGCRLAGTLAVPGGTRRDLVLEVVA